MASLEHALTDAAAQLAPSATARRDAQMLLLHVTGLTRATLLTYPDRELTKTQLADYQTAITRRRRHEPVQYITGVQEFYGRPFQVSPAVLIPRPETEHLVEAVLAIGPRRLLDVGTGSGILAITLALELPNASVMAADISRDALDMAQKNAAALGATEQIRFVVSDLLGAIPGEPFDCIVSNPPYVSADEILESQVSDFEPSLALYAGADGLAIYRRLIPAAATTLTRGGHLLLEIGHGQREAIEALLAASGFADIRFIDDLQGIPRAACAEVS